MAVEVACLKREAAALDDGKSDIIGIAVAVDSACAAERHASIEELSRGQGMAFYQRAYSRSENEGWKMAAQAVAMHRAGK